MSNVSSKLRTQRQMNFANWLSSSIHRSDNWQYERGTFETKTRIYHKHAREFNNAAQKSSFKMWYVNTKTGAKALARRKNAAKYARS